MENNPNNPAATILMLMQLMIKYCDTWDRHRNTIINNLKDKVKEDDKTIKEAQKKYNTLDEDSKKNENLLEEANNAMKDLKNNLQSLLEPLKTAHTSAMEDVYRRNKLPESKDKYIKDNNLTKEGQELYDKLMRDQGYGKENIEKLIDNNKYAQIIKNTITKYGKMCEEGKPELVDENGELTKEGRTELGSDFIKGFVEDKVREFVFGNKIENSMVKSKGQENNKPDKNEPILE